MTISTNVAIIGAGPYGLSIAAHLRAHGIEHRIFGSPMLGWRTQMPKGMFLKSEGFASNLHDPSGYSLQRFCAENSLPYADTHHPVPLDTFIDYGLAFQRHSALNVEEKSVLALAPAAGGFALRLDTGESLTARRVVLAVGLNYFRNIPDYLAHLPGERFTHSADHHDVSRFNGQDVSVFGGGASALDLVAALQQAGARPRLVARRRAIKWNLPLGSPPKLRLSPIGGLGGGWRNYAIEHAPMLYRQLPASTRLRVARNWLGPAGRLAVQALGRARDTLPRTDPALGRPEGLGRGAAADRPLRRGNRAQDRPRHCRHRLQGGRRQARLCPSNNPRPASNHRTDPGSVG